MTLHSLQEREHNGVAERMNITIAQNAYGLRLKIGLAKNFWAEAVNMICFLINRSLGATLDVKVPEKV